MFKHLRTYTSMDKVGLCQVPWRRMAVRCGQLPANERGKLANQNGRTGPDILRYTKGTLEGEMWPVPICTMYLGM